jgi:hypothetical protein
VVPDLTVASGPAEGADAKVKTNHRGVMVTTGVWWFRELFIFCICCGEPIKRDL